MESFFPLIFIVFVILAIALGIYGYFQSLQRKKELEAWAASQGLSFNPDKDWSMKERYSAFSCLRRGSNEYAYNIIQGTKEECPVCAFDYHYETYSTDSKGNRQTHHHYFSTLIQEIQLPLKPLFIRTEHFFDKVTEFLGHDDIDFESSEFSRKFYVKSPDKKWAFDVIQQSTMEFLLAQPRFAVEFQGNLIMAYRDSTFDIVDFTAAFNVIKGILDRLPDYLLRELKGEK